MKHLIILFLFLQSLTSQSQNFGDPYTGGLWTINDVKKNMNKKIEEIKKTRAIISSTEKIVNDTLVYFVVDSFDGFVIKMTFNLKQEYSEENYCDFQQIEFDCTPCGNKHLKGIISMNGFRQKSEYIYLSSFLFRTEMTVKYKSENKECLVVTFRYVDLPKKEYKKQYKQLKKKTQ